MLEKTLYQLTDFVKKYVRATEMSDSRAYQKRNDKINDNSREKSFKANCQSLLPQNNKLEKAAYIRQNRNFSTTTNLEH